MALHKRDFYKYGDSQADIREELLRYSTSNGHAAQHFADAVCKCGGKVFRLLLDESEAAAVRVCVACKSKHPIADSGDHLKESAMEENACPCGWEEFEVTVGASVLEGSDDVRWLYLGCRCTKCALTAVYADWKSNFNGYKQLLAQV